MRPTRRRLLSCALLVLGVAAIYARTVAFEFVNFDDGKYVTDNPVVSEGLTWSGVKWAFTAVHAANWHPLTWLSHMLDVELFGFDAGGHHAVNVLLHALGAVLLFLFLDRSTGRPWVAFFATALFAWHPLRVESVAWVAERKDVLSGAFFFATLLAYARHSQNPGPGRYALVAAFFACGLLAKPMLVTLPFVLLLLDRWPLERHREHPWRRLVVEKLPLFALAVASSAVTLWAQDAAGATSSAAELAPGLRAANALGAFAVYVRQTVWPADLACFYPHAVVVADDPYAALFLPAVAGGLLLAAGSVLAVVWRRTLPELFSGWWWTVGMLIPVIGLVQVGLQAHADRYTYLPLVGLGVAGCALGAGLVERRPGLLPPVVGVAVVASLACLAASRSQVEVWRDSRALFEHALAVTDDNFRAHGNLGYTLLQEERYAEAAEHFAEAARIHPVEQGVLAHLGLSYLRLNRVNEAEDPLLRAVRYEPANALAYGCLGEVSFRRNDYEKAARRFTRALDIDPDRIVDRVSLGLGQLQLGRVADARSSFELALRQDADHPLPHYGLGELEKAAKNWETARAHYERALELDPDLGAAHLGLALTLEALGLDERAVEHRRKARGD